MSKLQAIIGLGSNLENPVMQIKQAFEMLGKVPGCQLLAKSPLYKSKAMLMDDAHPQPDYINAVALLETELSAHELLSQLHSIENQQGRVRTERWGARTLDLDILTYGEQQINEPDLQVPHVGITERNFVLYPLQAMMGDEFVIPGKDNVAALVKQCPAEGLEKLNLDFE
jgi:2-amino-4-hydroxy-6-hydroxymethyldihydropteridine diphosphokinase